MFIKIFFIILIRNLRNISQLLYYYTIKVNYYITEDYFILLLLIYEKNNCKTKSK